MGPIQPAGFSTNLSIITSDFIILVSVLRIVGSRTALERAKFNLETLFSVVGVVGREAETLRALDAYLPLFAHGAQKLEKGCAFY